MKILIIPIRATHPIRMGNVSEITFSEPMYGPKKHIAGKYYDGTEFEYDGNFTSVKIIGWEYEGKE